MSSLYSFTKSLKACLFTTVLYGWLLPTAWVADHLNDWMPSRQLKSTDWVIEAGQPNTSWDLITVDGTHTVHTTAETRPSQDINSSTISERHTSSTPRPSEAQIVPASEELIGTESDNGKPHTAVPSTKVANRHLAKGDSNHTAKRFISKRTTARTGKCNVENPNITKSGKNAYTLPKSTLKHYSTHWRDASRLAHLSWAMKNDGSRLGIRIRGISCKSPLKFTGLRRGDVVLSINEHTVLSEKDLLKVYGRLLFWKKVDVKVKRGNRTLTLKYKIT